MIRYLAIALALAAASPIGSAGAQLIGPPISPHLQFDAQPMPRTQLPQVYVPSVGDIGPPISPQLQFDAQPMPRTQLPPVYVPPVGDSAMTYSTPLIPAPAQGASRGRAAECQHQAAVERVPRSRRSGYVHNCMMN